MDTKKESVVQIVWGVLIAGMGIALFFRIPQIIPQIEASGAFSSDIAFKRICLYLMGSILVCGGIQKIRTQYKKLARNSEPQSEKK
jgi:hypothetical protein